MPQTAKKSASEKIVESLSNLATVSTERSQIENVLSLTDNEVVQKFISAQKSRYDADIKYMRERIVRQAGKVTETMTVDQFSKFATGLAKLLS